MNHGRPPATFWIEIPVQSEISVLGYVVESDSESLACWLFAVQHGRTIDERFLSALTLTDALDFCRTDNDALSAGRWQRLNCDLPNRNLPPLTEFVQVDRFTNAAQVSRHANSLTLEAREVRHVPIDEAISYPKNIYFGSIALETHLTALTTSPGSQLIIPTSKSPLESERLSRAQSNVSAEWIDSGTFLELHDLSGNDHVCYVAQRTGNIAHLAVLSNPADIVVRSERPNIRTRLRVKINKQANSLKRVAVPDSWHAMPTFTPEFARRYRGFPNANAQYVVTYDKSNLEHETSCIRVSGDENLLLPEDVSLTFYGLAAILGRNRRPSGLQWGYLET